MKRRGESFEQYLERRFYSDIERAAARADGIELPVLRPRVVEPPPPHLKYVPPPPDPETDPANRLCILCTPRRYRELCARCTELIKQPHYRGPLLAFQIARASSSRDCIRCKMDEDPFRVTELDREEAKLCNRCAGMAEPARSRVVRSGGYDGSLSGVRGTVRGSWR